MTTETAEKTHPAPSFAGRLELNSFRYTPDTTAPSGPRRSPRLLSQASSSSTPPAPAKSPSPTKRKASSIDPTAAEPEDTSSSSSSTTSTTTTTRQPTPSPRKRTTTTKKPKPSTGYAPPSAYSHLPPGIPDALAPNLLVFFIGLNPGIETARRGHAYAHPSNLFWKLLHASGVTPRRCDPSEDRTLPARYALGLTNIVSRPSRSGAELSKAEMDAGVAVLEAKCRRWRPEAVCVVGKSIWESIFRVRKGRGITSAEFRYGWQDEGENMGVVEGDPSQVQEDEKEEGVVYAPDWKGARIFVATSTSGLAASLRPHEKEAIWKELGDWVVERRRERAREGDEVAKQALEVAGITV
ncbi:hypothetical protein VTJ49DRAFT_5974 [Mycothermus thermophilus]|uniref:Uracil-DNA glycosylase-like domain-containing protein n=1 Tax=Humicola insolens TaxID=85995 RepID=A0ABR3V2M7_HUMIN